MCGVSRPVERMSQRNASTVQRIIESLGVLPGPVSRPALVLISGLPGAGKSHFSRALAGESGLALVQSDAVRKLLFPNPTYEANESYIVFMRCHDVVQRLLQRGIGVIFDATNLKERNRKRLYKIAEQTGAKLAIVRVEAPPEVVSERLERRAAREDLSDISDATWEVYQQMASTAERIKREHYVVDTSEDIGPIVKKLVRDLKGP